MADRLPPGVRLALLLVAAYRVLLSPIVGGACRFSPSCSAYAEEAFRSHGAWKGGKMTLRRLARCHPWGGWGFDPVPPALSLAPQGSGPEMPAHGVRGVSPRQEHASRAGNESIETPAPSWKNESSSR